jgi:hypothetical protein
MFQSNCHEMYLNSKFLIESIVPDIPKRLYIDELRRELGVRESNSKQNGKTVKDGEKALESFKIFAQVNSRLMEFLIGWLLVLGLKECLVECATVCVKSVVMLYRVSHV